MTADDRPNAHNSTLRVRREYMTRSPWPAPSPGAPYSTLPRGSGFRTTAATRGGVVVPMERRRPDDYIPRAVRRMVLERDGCCCLCCGISIIGRRYSLGHRLRASQGGKAVASNLITLLGWGGEECHGRIDLYRDPDDAAEMKGYRIRSGAGPEHDPLYVPVAIFSEDRRYLWVWLTDDGRYSDRPPQDGAA